MTQLLLKELRQLWPIAWLWIGIVTLSVVGELMSSRIDEASFASWCGGSCDLGVDTGTAVFTMLLILVTAYSLFPREHDESTIDFLNALPISRATIFTAKLVAAWVLVCGLILFAYLITALSLSFNPQSIDGKFYFIVDRTLFLRDCAFAFVILSHGIFLSYFRTVGLLLYAAYLLILMWLETQFGSIGAWSVFQMVSNRYHGQTLLVDFSAILSHVLAAIVLLFISYRLWSRADSRPKNVTSRRSAKRWVASLSAVGAFFVVTLIMVFQVGRQTGSVSMEDNISAQTEHYRFVYRQSDAEVAKYLLSNADTDYLAMAALLDASTLPEIQANMSVESEHAAGLAKWKKILMDLSDFENEFSQRRVLSHETAHVFQAVESDRGLSRNFNASRFFIEGMAQYASFAIVPETQRRKSNWRIAAVAWDRQKIRVDQLMDDAQFRAKFDPELYYSLGDIWTDALVRTCGLHSLGALLRAAGRQAAPVDLSPEYFWRDTLQFIGCEFEDVNDAWRKQLRSVLDTQGDADFPHYVEVSIRREAESGRVQFRAALRSVTDTSLPTRFYLRIASTAKLTAQVDRLFFGQLDGETDDWHVDFSVPASAIPSQRFRYQLGYMPETNSRAYFDRWVNGSVVQP